jgi:hypothetical protein
MEDNHLKLIRGVYRPIGNRMFYPKGWGKKKGSLSLFDHLIESDSKVIEQATKRLEKLKKCKEKIELEWKDK